MEEAKKDIKITWLDWAISLVSILTIGKFIERIINKYNYRGWDFVFTFFCDLNFLAIAFVLPLMILAVATARNMVKIGKTNAESVKSAKGARIIFLTLNAIILPLLLILVYLVMEGCDIALKIN